MTYETIPVKSKIKKSVLLLCDVYGMGSRAQGALVGRLVKTELQQAKAQGLISDAQLAEIEKESDNDQPEA